MDYLIRKGDPAPGASEEAGGSGSVAGDTAAAASYRPGPAPLAPLPALSRQGDARVQRAVALRRSRDSDSDVSDEVAAFDETSDDDREAERAPSLRADERRFVCGYYGRERAQLARGARVAWRAADALERCANALAFRDAPLSVLAAAALALTGIAASLLLAALRALGFGAHHAVFTLCVACLVPGAGTLTRAVRLLSSGGIR